MSRKRYSAELLIGQLRQAEILVSGGKTIAEVVRQLNISEQTYYRRRKEYGGLGVDQARRLKELEQENGRLKRLVADQALDISILKEASRGNFCARRAGSTRGVDPVSPFSRRRLAETSEPGVAGSVPGAADAALHTKGFGRRSGTDGKHCLSGIRVWMNTPARVWRSR